MSTQISKADAQELLNKVDLISWLHHHNTDVERKFADEKESKEQYKKLLQSLKTEYNPHSVASLLITPVGSTPLNIGLSGSSSSSYTDSMSSFPLVDEAVAGKIAKDKLHRSIRRKPSNSVLSPATVLTEARRREIS